jgi:hypothetical protein
MIMMRNDKVAHKRDSACWLRVCSIKQSHLCSLCSIVLDL